MELWPLKLHCPTILDYINNSGTYFHNKNLTKTNVFYRLFPFYSFLLIFVVVVVRKVTPLQVFSVLESSTQVYVVPKGTL